MSEALESAERPLSAVGALASAVRSASERKRISILGATGSVGGSTVSVVEEAGGADSFDVSAVAAGSDAEGLAAIARRLRADVAVVADEAAYPALRDALAGSGVEAAAGADRVTEAAALPADWVMAAVVGVAGLAPALAAARSGADVALANKEALVSAGALFLDAMAAGGGALLPVDSEHNAVFQIFDPAQADAVERITLTASGGPFRDWTLEQMAGATPGDALKHPTWSMGAKISIDSATMFNKGLEIIEAARLFGVGPERIEALVHPQSVVHALVAYHDGAVLAELGCPDMRTPIAHALAHPTRMRTSVARLDLAAVGALEFRAPDLERFPALRIAREALEIDGPAPAALNAANEAAVAAFLAGDIGFLDIPRMVEQAIDDAIAAFPGRPPADLEAVMAVDARARASATSRRAPL